MTKRILNGTRRDILSGGAIAAAAVVVDRAGLATKAFAANNASEIIMDGHVHITNRIYWEGIDPWTPTQQGWDFARARAAGVNCIIDNLGPYGYWNYNYTPKQFLRLMDTLLRFSEKHSDKMAIALSADDARRIVGSGRMAVFIGCESGFDHEGDADVLDAFYRLGLRSVQFTTQSGFNSFSDSALAQFQGGQKPDHFNGINEQGRKLVTQMNSLGILIDIAHATEAAQTQLIQASRAPVAASHETIKAVSGAGLSDDVVKALAAKGGLVGIHGGAAVVSKRYRQWMASNPAGATNASKAVFGMLGFQPSVTRPPGDHGEFIAKMDSEFSEKWKALADWKEDPSAVLPTVDEYVAHIEYVIKLVGADHVAIGLDMVNGRSSIPADPTGYTDLIAAIRKLTTPENARKILGENWMRVFEQAKAT